MGDVCVAQSPYALQFLYGSGFLVGFLAVVLTVWIARLMRDRGLL